MPNSFNYSMGTFKLHKYLYLSDNIFKYSKFFVCNVRWRYSQQKTIKELYHMKSALPLKTCGEKKTDLDQSILTSCRYFFMHRGTDMFSVSMYGDEFGKCYCCSPDCPPLVERSEVSDIQNLSTGKTEVYFFFYQCCGTTAVQQSTSLSRSLALHG